MRNLLKSSVGNAEKFARDEANEVRGILGRIKRRDLKGNSGQAIKNSSFNLTKLLVAKIGSLIFTVLLARILLPELYGLYSLALSTILLFSVFSDFGVGSTMIHFLSKSFGKKDERKAKAYLDYFLKLKLTFMLFSSLLLLASAYFIATYYYQKPILLALVLGALFYLPVVNLLGFIEYFYTSLNNFKTTLWKEVIFQTFRLGLFVVLLKLILNITTDSPEKINAWLIFASSICYLVVLVYLLLKVKSMYGSILKQKPYKLSKEAKSQIRRFMIPLSIMLLSGILFGYIDTLMLGHFVSGEFIGYYGAAFNLIASATAVAGFAGVALFPIFSRLKKKSLEEGFDKSRRLTLTISIIGAVMSYLLAAPLILLIYNSAYSAAIPLMKLFCVLLIIAPLIAIYESYYISRGKISFLAKLLIGTTIINLIANYFFITYGLTLGMMQATIGVGVATVLSRFIYLVGLMVSRKRV